MSVELNHAIVACRDQWRSPAYAFPVGQDDFDAVLGRITARGVPRWTDPGRSRPGVISHRDGGQGGSFADPYGHLMEVLTRPYGSAD